jgi:hypothetical protein
MKRELSELRTEICQLCSDLNTSSSLQVQNKSTMDDVTRGFEKVKLALESIEKVSKPINCKVPLFLILLNQKKCGIFRPAIDELYQRLSILLEKAVKETSRHNYEFANKLGHFMDAFQDKVSLFFTTQPFILTAHPG